MGLQPFVQLLRGFVEATSAPLEHKATLLELRTQEAMERVPAALGAPALAVIVIIVFERNRRCLARRERRGGAGDT